MRTTAPRSRRGARPARQESAHGFNPKRRRACLCGGASRRGRHQRRPSRDEVATMRARNTMRFSAPTREPPGGRPSRGAKLKGRGCTRQKDARNENRLGGTGAAKKAPSEQGATKAAGLGAADARLEPRQWSAAERLSRDRRRKRRCCARPLMKAKAHGACGAQHFVFINARYSLAHTKAGARSGDAGNTDFPLGFYWVGCAVGCVVIYVFSFFTLCVLTCYRAYDGLRLRIESAMRGWMDGFKSVEA